MSGIKKINSCKQVSENLHKIVEHSSGRDRLLNSIIWSWGGHLVFVIAGFLLPRFIDRNIGQAMLGVWDFSWSLVSYSSLIMLGVGSSVNRYVAMHLAQNNVEGLNESISSVFCIQFLMGLTVLIITALLIWALPLFWSNTLGALIPDAQWLVFYLGISNALGFAFGAFDGVLTGCHRWDIYNSVNAGSHAVGITAMIIVLTLGGGILWLGFLYFVETVLLVLTKLVLVYKVCPVLNIRAKYARVSVALSMLRFGGKAYVNQVSRILLYQTNSILIVTFLGPVMLALYARPMALVHHVSALSVKLAHTITPVASELHSTGDRSDLAELILKMARYNVAMALPLVTFMCILGGPLLLLWMGKLYQNDILISILAGGHLFTIANQPLQTALIGINAHGRPAIFTFCAAIVSILLCYLSLTYWQGGLTFVALSVCAPLMLADGVFITTYSCRKLNLPMSEFATKVWLEPVLCVTPFAICLLLVRIIFPPITALFLGILLGGVLLLLIYWKWMLPLPLRDKILGVCSKCGLSRVWDAFSKN